MTRLSIVVGWRIHPPWLDGTAVLARSTINSIIKLSKQLSVSPCVISTYWVPEHRRLNILTHDLREYIASHLIKLSSIKFLKEPLIDPALPMFSAIAKIIKCFNPERTYIHLFDQVVTNEVQLITLLRKFRLLSRKRVYIIHHIRTYTQCTSILFKSLVISKSIDICAFTSPILRSIYHRILQHNSKDKPKLFIIPPGIDVNFFKKYSKKCYEIVVKRLSLDSLYSHDYCILHMGSISDDRFPANIVMKSISKLRREGINALMIIAPRDPIKSFKDMRMMIHLAQKYNLKGNIILLKRYLSEYEKVSLLNIVDVALQLYSPRLAHDVILPPLTLLEAMSCGTPVISTRTIYTIDTIKHNLVTSLVLRELNVNELSSRLRLILIDDNFKKKITNIEREIIEKYFSLEVMANAIKELYKELE